MKKIKKWKYILATFSFGLGALGLLSTTYAKIKIIAPPERKYSMADTFIIEAEELGELQLQYSVTNASGGVTYYSVSLNEIIAAGGNAVTVRPVTINYTDESAHLEIESPLAPMGIKIIAPPERK